MHIRSFRFIKEINPIYKFNGEELTKDDLQFLYRQGDKLSILSIATLFECEPLTVYLHLYKHHIDTRIEDSGYYLQAVELDAKMQKVHTGKIEKKLNEHKREADAEIRKKAIEIYGKPRPEPVVQIINGKRYVDNDLVKFYDRKIREIMIQLKGGGVKKTKELNRYRSVDLSAMRLHRGLDMVKFSNVSGIPYKSILYYEKTPHVIIPKEVSDCYIKVLNISNREFKKIRECLSGDRKTMFEEDNRELPESVREYVFKRDKGKCQKCGATKYIHFHHIERYSKGGKHEAKNLKLLCVKCHAMEHYGEKGFALLKAQAEKLLGGEIQWAN